MDSSGKIQSIKNQIENLKSELDKIESENNAINEGKESRPCTIGEQLVNMSFKIFDVGIQTFKTGKNSFETLIMERFINQLKKISEQIKEMISDSESTIKFQNKDQAQLFYQQQMMLNQMNNPILFQQQMLNQGLFQQQMGWKYFNFTFVNALEGNKNFIKIEGNKTIKDLLDQYITEAYGNNNNNIKQIRFICNAQELERNDPRKIGDYFKIGDSFMITVLNFNK